jgi:hypothetical protein
MASMSFFARRTPPKHPPAAMMRDDDKTIGYVCAAVLDDLGSFVRDWLVGRTGRRIRMSSMLPWWIPNMSRRSTAGSWF